MDFYNRIRCFQTTVQVKVELDVLLFLVLGALQPNNRHKGCFTFLRIKCQKYSCYRAPKANSNCSSGRTISLHMKLCDAG